jgi:hypothetical protein
MNPKSSKQASSLFLLHTISVLNSHFHMKVEAFRAEIARLQWDALLHLPAEHPMKQSIWTLNTDSSDQVRINATPRSLWSKAGTSIRSGGLRWGGWRPPSRSWPGTTLWRRRLGSPCGGEGWDRPVEAKAGITLWRRRLGSPCGGEG